MKDIGNAENILTFLRRIVLYLSAKKMFDWMPDKLYLKLIYFCEIGKKINLDEPQLFNEKLNWLKLYDRRKHYSIMVDKYLVKDYVTDKIGEEYVIPLYGVWEKFDDIDFDILPDKFVLKTTHDCGGVIVCKNKSKLDLDVTKKLLGKHLMSNYYKWRREWPYKNVVPRIIAEEYVKDGSRDYLPVYKFFCFNGKAKIIQSIQNDKQKDETIDYFDTDWSLLEIRQNFPNSNNPMQKPEKLDEMIRISEKLAQDTKFLRVDLYLVNDTIKFSEFTFYSDAGFAKFQPEEWDERLGQWIDIEN